MAFTEQSRLECESEVCLPEALKCIALFCPLDSRKRCVATEHTNMKPLVALACWEATLDQQWAGNKDSMPNTGSHIVPLNESFQRKLENWVSVRVFSLGQFVQFWRIVSVTACSWEIQAAIIFQ
eukprot:6378277-Amphidinium_carterae.1